MTHEIENCIIEPTGCDDVIYANTYVMNHLQRVFTPTETDISHGYRYSDSYFDAILDVTVLDRVGQSCTTTAKDVGDSRNNQRRESVMYGSFEKS